ncbi:MAG: 8-oxoguanine deaminase [Spirochaetes bacterium RBG_13_68_11]|nr:MAG: 8-oxoguanine deaminase [Spirochaetes bacterium RBG_13_68_11]
MSAPAGLLLKDCLLVQPSADGPGLPRHDVLVEGNTVRRVAPSLAAPAGTRVIDCSTHVVVPGFINTHHHFYQTLTRNLPAVQDAKLFDWLVHLYGVWRRIDAEAVRVSTLLALAELAKTGCTCSTDHLYLYPRGLDADFTALQFAAADALGMRFAPCRGSMSRSRKDGGLPPDDVVQDEPSILADSERVVRAFHDPAPFAMHRVMLAPCSPFSVSEELMKETAALARRLGVRLHTHLAETADENEFCLERHGVRPLALMERCSFVGPDVSFAHGIHFTDDELDTLARCGSQVAHCPTSNMRLGSGICRVRDMLDRGITVSLAVDGSASNDSSDFLGEMRHALLLQRVARGSAALGARDVLSMATEGGARTLGFERIGRIEPGYAADLAVFDVGRLEYAGSLSDPLAALVFAGYNHGTAYTIVNGKLVVDGGRLVGVDERELTDRANRAAARLLSPGP